MTEQEEKLLQKKIENDRGRRKNCYKKMKTTKRGEKLLQKR
jgi:hypothetical protein